LSHAGNPAARTGGPSPAHTLMQFSTAARDRALYRDHDCTSRQAALRAWRSSPTA